MVLLFLIVFLFIFININFVSAEYFRIKCTSSTNSPSIRFGYVDRASDGDDGSHDALYPPSPLSSRIDFYLENSGNDYMTDARSGGSLTDFYAKIDGVSVTGILNADLSFSFYDDGQGYFDGKDFLVKLYNASDYTNPTNLIASYDIYDLISGYESFPELNITTGLSYQLVITPSLTPGTGFYSSGNEIYTGLEGLFINKKELNIPMIIGEVKTEKIELYNKGSSSINIAISIKELKNILTIEGDRFFKLGPGERRIIEIKISAPSEVGIYTGKIIINGQEVLVSLNVNPKKLLFDTKITIPNELKIINRGDNLKAKINLKPLIEEELEITFKYIIKDFSGKVFLTETEKIKVNGDLTFTKEFQTKNLRAGDYILGLELISGEKVATASVNFKVIEKGLELSSLSGNSMLIILIISILIIIVLILIKYALIKKRVIKKNKKHKKHKR